jgi:hypothetical protein
MWKRLYVLHLRNYRIVQSVWPICCTRILTSSLRLWSTLLGLSTQRSFRHLFQPTRLPLNSARFKVVLPTRALEHLRPPINRVLDLLPRLPQFLFPNLLLLRRNVLLVKVWNIHRNIRPLCAAQIRHRVLDEAPGDERARGILACEDVVAAAGAVDAAAGRDVVNGAVEREVDGLARVTAVVGEELGVGQGDGSLLGVFVRFVRLSELRAGRETYQVSHHDSWADEPWPPAPKHRVVCDEVAQQAIEQE